MNLRRRCLSRLSASRLLGVFCIWFNQRNNISSVEKFMCGRTLGHSLHWRFYDTDFTVVVHGVPPGRRRIGAEGIGFDFRVARPNLGI